MKRNISKEEGQEKVLKKIIFMKKYSDAQIELLGQGRTL